MESTKKSQSHSDRTLSFIPLLICPFCRQAIPHLTLKPNTKQIDIIVSCSCLTEDKVLSLKQFINSLNSYKAQDNQCSSHSANKAMKYCSKCKTWLCEECVIRHESSEKDHELWDQELQFKCSLHNLPYSRYCDCCQTNYCQTCPRKNKHRQYLFNLRNHRMDLFIIALNQKERIITKLIGQIEAEDNQLNTVAHIRSSFKAFESINAELTLLYQSFIFTVKAYKKLPTFRLQELKQSIGYSINDYINEQYHQLLTDLRKYLVKQTDLNERIGILPGHQININCLLKLSDDRLASGSFDGVVKLWNVTTKECIATLIHSNFLSSLIELSDCRLASSGYGILKLWNTTTYEFTETIMLNDRPLIQLKDGRLAFWSLKIISIWSLTPLKLNASLIGHCNNIIALIQLKDGRLVSCSIDHLIKLWDLSSNECIATLAGHKSFVLKLIELKDGRLASGSRDKRIMLWSLTTKECCAYLEGHESSVCVLIELKDGRLASGSEDGTIKLWDAISNRCIATLQKGDTDVNLLIELNDGRLAHGGADIIKLWNLTTNESTTKYNITKLGITCLILYSDSLIAGAFGNYIVLAKI